MVSDSKQVNINANNLLTFVASYNCIHHIECQVQHAYITISLEFVMVSKHTKGAYSDLKIEVNVRNTFVMSRNKHISKKSPCFPQKSSRN